VLRLWEGLSVTETADLLQISEGTVKSYTARAVTRLRPVRYMSVTSVVG